MPERRDLILAAAREFRDLGYSPWPMRPRDKMPLNVPDRDGRSWGGQHHHRPMTDDEIEKVFGSKSPPDLAVRVGDGHVVVDLDPKNNPAVVNLFETLLERTRCAWTPSKGLHAYFTATGRAVRTNDPAAGIDVQGYGSLVVVPPSYGRTWANLKPEAEVDPDWLTEWGAKIV